MFISFFKAKWDLKQEHESVPEPHSFSAKDKSDMRIFYSDKLGLVWGKYMTLSNVLIGISGATVLLIFNSVKIVEVRSPDIKFLVASVLFGALSLVFAVVWRMFIQRYFENDVLADRLELKHYLQVFDIDSTTPAYKRTNNETIRLLCRTIHYSAPYSYAISLLISWFFILLFIYHNSSK
jgi:hypothetical protein